MKVLVLRHPENLRPISGHKTLLLLGSVLAFATIREIFRLTQDDVREEIARHYKLVAVLILLNQREIIMEWVWVIFKEYITKKLIREGNANPADEELEAEFLDLLRSSTVTILVQEPWQNSVRFKGLAKHDVPDIMELINQPMEYLFENYGGGKFKLNFHQGWNFIATQNFKPEGEPQWVDLPDIGY